jgi:hypothetical protein
VIDRFASQEDAATESIVKKLDQLYSGIFHHANKEGPDCLDLPPRVFRALALAWNIGSTIKFNHVSMVTAIFRELHPVTELMTIFEVSAQGLACIIASKLRTAFSIEQKQAMEYDFDPYIEITHLIRLLSYLSEESQDIMAGLAEEGLLTSVIKAGSKLVAFIGQSLKSNERYGLDVKAQSIFLIVHLVRDAMDYQPRFVVQALKYQFLEVLLSTCILWTSPGIVSPDMLSRQQRANELCLDTIETHLYHLKVIKHLGPVVKRRSMLNMLPQYIRVCSFAARYQVFLNRMDKAIQLKREYSMRNVGNICENERYASYYLLLRVIGLSEHLCS